MITAEKIVYDIRRALKEFNVGSGSITDSILYHKIDIYAESLKKMEFSNTKRIDPSWILNLGKVDTELVNSGDDPVSTNGSVVFSKYALPNLIQFGDHSYVRISSGLRTGDFTKLESFDIFYRIYNADRKVLEENPVYVLFNNTVYVYPSRIALTVSLIPSSPFDCKIKKILVDPISGQQLYDGLTSRPFSKWDQYPISGDIVTRLIVEYMTKEHGVTEQKVQDFTQNGTSEE